LRRAWFTFGVLCLSTVPASEVETVETPYVPDEHELEIFVGGRVGYLEVEDVDKGSPIVGFVYGLQPHRHLAFKGTLDYHSANFSREERRTFALTASVEVYPLSYGYHAGIGLDIDCCWLESGTRAIINLEARWMFTQEEEGTLEVRPDGVQYTAGVKFQF
jgi:hypothetical protein